VARTCVFRAGLTVAVLGDGGSTTIDGIDVWLLLGVTSRCSRCWRWVAWPPARSVAVLRWTHDHGQRARAERQRAGPGARDAVAV